MPFRILIVLIFEIASSAFCLVSPYFGLLLYLVWAFVRPQDDRPNVRELHFPFVLGVSLALSTVGRLHKLQMSPLLATQRLAPILLFFILMVTSALANGLTPLSSYRLGEFGLVILTCYLVLLWSPSEYRILGVIGTFVFSGAYIAREALRHNLNIREQIGDQEFTRLGNRMMMNFGNSNYLGLLMAVCILICLNLLWARLSKWLKLLVIPLIVIFGEVFLKANSRGASLGLAAGLMVYWVLQKRKGLTVIILGLVIVAAVVFGPDAYFDRLQTIASYQEDASATGRLELWDIGLSLIRDHPVLGVGPDNFILYATNSPHDAYIQVASEIGLPAALLYCVILISGITACSRAIRITKTLPGSENLRAAALAMLCVITEIVIQGLTTGFAHREFVYIFIATAHCIYVTARTRARDAQAAQSPGEVPLVPAAAGIGRPVTA